jgi:hypothetical protein
MRKLLLAAVAVTALAACDRHGFKISKEINDDDRNMRVVTQLTCPEHQGELTRVRTAPDGASCDYAGPRGALVTLSLVKLSQGQDGEAAMKPTEGQLQALMPGALARLAKADAKDHADAAADHAEDAADKAQDSADKAEDKAEAAADRAEEAADRAADQAERAEGRHDDADVRMPGVSVKTHGDAANVRLPGIHVDADKNGGAHINIAGIHIDADGSKSDRHSGRINASIDNNDVSIRAQDDAAEIRARHKGAGLRLTYIITDKDASASGWRVVGYEARGPASGPLVVAVVKSKDDRENPIFHDAKALVHKNVEP